MSETKHTPMADGGPAFPVQDAAAWQAHGMTLRDYFAGQALAGLMANPERYNYIASQVRTYQLTQEEASAKNARKAYYLADAMLAARAAAAIGASMKDEA